MNIGLDEEENRWYQTRIQNVTAVKSVLIIRDLDCGILIKRVYFACTQATSLVLLMESQSTRPTGGKYNTTVMWSW
jgi:hypothetical protein